MYKLAEYWDMVNNGSLPTPDPPDDPEILPVLNEIAAAMLDVAGTNSDQIDLIVGSLLMGLTIGRDYTRWEQFAS